MVRITTSTSGTTRTAARENEREIVFVLQRSVEQGRAAVWERADNRLITQ